MHWSTTSLSCIWSYINNPKKHRIFLLLWPIETNQLHMINSSLSDGVQLWSGLSRWKFGRGVANLVCRLNSFLTDLKLARNDFADLRNITYWFTDWDFSQEGVTPPTLPNIGKALAFIQYPSLLYQCQLILYIFVVKWYLLLLINDVFTQREIHQRNIHCVIHTVFY